MLGSASLFHMHASLESDYAILTYILHLIALCRGPKWGEWYNTPPLNTSLDVHVLMVTAYYCSHSLKPYKCFRKMWLVKTVFL